ncbi:amidohydrolase family protein [Candidatus Bathyarchaeota archaeon]|nr:amidohydrolase family protein [Candidatus Bathyarchaeota archaeon]
MLRIKNARMVKNEEWKEVNIYVEEGKIKDILPRDEALLSVEREVDTGGKVVFPGFIDPHVHFDNPGFTERENFETGTKSAAAGGITTIMDMPCTSIPPITTASNFDYKLNIVKPNYFLYIKLY